MAKMSDISPSTAVRYAGKRIRELLFAPFDLKFILYVSSISPFGRKDDPRLLELKRLKPYYKGTRLLTALGVALVLLSLLLPFTVFFVGLSGFYVLLIAYIIMFIAVSVAGVFFEAVTDAVFAIEHETKATLPEAAREFFGHLKDDPGYVIRYMLIKLAADMFLMAVVMALYLPALLGAIVMLQSLTVAVTEGATNLGPMMTPWLFAIAFLLIMAVFLTGMLSVPISAFYGYYTEYAVKAMRTEPAYAR
jgi:hypothetical protein